MLPPEYLRGAAAGPSTSLDRRRVHLLVLEGGHALLSRARHALERGDVTGFACDLQRTQEALVELVRTLDRGESAVIAERLGALHDSLLGQLALVSAERSLARVDAALRAFGPIVEAYREIVRHAGGR